MALYTHHLPAWKRREVEEIKADAGRYALIGLVDMYGIPATQLQQIRRNLRGSVKLKMTRNTLIEHAFSEIGGEIAVLAGRLSGHSALIFTNENPFKLFKKLEKTKTKMVARPGEKAPDDIVVEKGPTSFKPGPIVGELQQAGIPAAIEAGKVKIRETRTVVRKGDTIGPKQADVLAKLGIKPMDVGLILQAAFYEGSLYEPSVLAIDEDLIFSQITIASQQAFNLSVNAVIPTQETAAPIIARAVREARGLAIEASIYEKDVIDGIIGKAQRESAALQNMVRGS
ncbi:MAG TPA: 50S ribosomal protein L10 [Methanoregulaceae archaeon]|nr:MAG: 50S ribosomal protein L10 [Methanolinea sp.]HON81430.1 50S ribosomal protein L10 [Methanoregulaceae archaeon]HPD10042.1 50S ribosomal protein L10 [Methanoregulaceae archaeon]HRT15048.1 50S ribosomal protein L10 [Methanoregulaceae archaeon]HRU30619.1 50S ribosomal protein L10 [Methanoregulaceae archaeon]